MYRIVTLLLVMLHTALFARSGSDISLTAGNNTFDNPAYLRSHRMFYGIRAGFYQKNGFGLQLGYEQANGVNCVGLDLKRVFANGLYLFAPVKQLPRVRPYAITTLGYESSNKEHYSPNQLYLGAGGGLRVRIVPALDLFVETRVLRKFKSDTTNIITTVGLSYWLGDRLYEAVNRQAYRHDPMPEIADKSPDSSLKEQSDYPLLELVPHKTHAKTKKRYKEHTRRNRGYYIQVAALMQSSPKPYLRRLRKAGLHKARVKYRRLHAKRAALVVVGPYRNRHQAQKALRKVKRVYPDAYIRRF